MNAIENNGTAIYTHKSIYATKQRRFSRTRRTNQAYDVSLVDTHRNSLKDFGRSERLPHIMDLDNGLRSFRGNSHDRAFSRSEEHTSELQSLMRTSYAVFCLKKNNEHVQ